MLCYRCGGHVKDGGATSCTSCGQRFDGGLSAGPGAGFGNGYRRPRHTVEGAPCQPGDIVAGRYRIREHIGAGPLGWMYRAVEATTEDVVALKILSPRFLQMPEEKRTFLAELNKAQRLSHANVARIYQAGDDAGRPFVASQHLEGLTLRRIMDLRRQKAQRFTLQEVEPIVAQIAAALDAASAAFAHGNLKPDNVVVLPDLLKLTDFGLAVSLPRAPFMAAQKAGGVHRYLAPEFLLGEPLDARTDVFSLGAMLGEMLSGERYEQQLNLLEKNPDLPAQVEALFRRAVAPRASVRFASAGEMAAELSDLVAGTPRPAPAPRPPVEDAGDVLIVEAHTDPRVRLARALEGDRSRKRDAAEILGSLPTPAPMPPVPFTAPPPYEPPAPVAVAVPVAIPAVAVAPEPLPVAAAPVEIPAPAPDPIPIAPAVQPEGDLLQVAASLGATPELLTADTAVRSAPEEPARDRPRRGVGKRGKERRTRRPVAALPAESDPAWASSAPPATEGALAIGPTTSALEPIRPETRRSETPSKPVRAVSFAALEEKPRSRAPIYVVGAIAVALAAGGAWATLGRPPAEPQQPRQDAAAEPAAKEPPKAVAPVAAPEKKPEPQAVEPIKPDSSRSRSLSEKVRAAREQAMRALAERKKQREEAVAEAAARRAEEKAAAKKTAPVVTSIPAPPKEKPATPAPAAEKIAPPPAAAAKPAPPAGAIHGLDDSEVMVSKDRPKPQLVAAAAPAAAAGGAVECPPGMMKVAGGPAAVGSDAADDLRNFGDRPLATVQVQPYCIDMFEFPNQPGRLPKVAAGFSEAEALCQNSGKRLCSEDEWEKACKGPQQLRFPYGQNFDPDACNTQDKTDSARQTSIVGAFARCKSAYGVWDMSGNVAEWTASSFDAAGPEKAVKGGHAARPSFDDRCASRRKLSPGAHDIKVGFRCCADSR